MSDFKNVGYLEDIDFSGKTLNLNKDNNDLYIVMIWTSWCGHCKTAHPEYQLLADSNTDNTVKITCIQADGERPSEQKLAAKLKNIIDGFAGFPTIVAYKNGKMVDTLNGERKLDNFKKFVKKNK